MAGSKEEGKIVKLEIWRVDATKEVNVGTKEAPIKATVPDFEAKVADSSKLTAQYNPDSFALSFEAEAPKTATPATSNLNATVSNQTGATAITKSNTFSFKLVFDSSFDGDLDIKQAVEFLNGLFYSKKGERVTPGVMVKYGEYIDFQGSPSKLSLTYALFDSSGYPVRVVADLTVTGNNKLDNLKGKTWTKMEEEDVAGSGDSLPNYAGKKLGNAALYTAVAKANKLPNLMKVTVGTKLKIPGIK